MRHTRIALLVVFSAGLLGLLVLAFARQISAASPAPAKTSGDAIWRTIDNSAISVAELRLPAKSSYGALRLNKDALARQLARAPMERTGNLRKSPAVVSLPMPDGSFQRFHFEESPVMDAELVARYPEIKSYRGQGVEDGTATVRFDWTPLGLHALVLSADHPAVNVLPPDRNDLTTYASYYDHRAAFKCGVTESRSFDLSRGAAPHVAIGTTLRTERLAVATTWEFCNTIGGDTVAGTVAAINAYLNTVNALYEKELSTHMNLVNAPNVIYATNNNVCGPGHNVACNAGNDPYTDSNESTMLGQVRPDLRDKVGSANYDVGHVLGTGGAGIAGLGVVCQNSDFGDGMGPYKGSGASRVFGPPGNSSASGLWAHELGHQHGGSHSFNGTTDFCGPSRSSSTAWEAGSGVTLMSYGGICGTDNVVSDTALRLHNGSYNEMLTYLAGSGSCATTSATGNAIPAVDAGAAKTIPKLTPFTLTATGSDADTGDVPNLRFVWEQLDAGGALYANPPYGDQAGDPNTTTRPLFRPFDPVADKSRTFPSLTYILNNANIPPATVGGFQTAENLPAVSRTMNFRCTVRDQRGGVNDSAVAITVAGGAGPFAVTFPNGGQTIGGAQNVAWNVSGTNAAPVSTANVKISLSTDGGNTFPTVLTASTPNSGSAMVTLPNGILNSTARIKVEAIGNIFFDISDANFGIAPGDGCLAASNFSPQLGPIGTVVTITGVNFTGVNSVTFNGTPATSFTVNNSMQITATVPNGATGGPIVLGKPGCSNLTVGSFSVCPNAPVTISIDDGTVETATGSGGDIYYVNRLTPATYPASVTRVSIYFEEFQSLPTGTPITVVAAANPGGTNNIDGLTFQSTPATVGTLGTFTTVTLTNGVTVNSGDFVVGFHVASDGFPGAIDTGSSQNRSYTGNGTNFFPRAPGNFMIRAAQVYTGCNGGAPTVSQVVSRKTHSGIPYDIALPLTGNVGIECRTTGGTNEYTLVATFANSVAVTGNPQAQVTSGSGTVGSGGASNGGAVTIAGAVVTVPLTNVTNAQRINVTLRGVNDGSGIGDVIIPMGVLQGDTSGNGSVTGTDVSQAKLQSGQAVTGSNFREDVVVNGAISGTDVSAVKLKSGTALPP
jgi:reprolysin-like metallo-peptidase family M12B